MIGDRVSIYEGNTLEMKWARAVGIVGNKRQVSECF